MSALLGRPVFSVGDRTYSWADVVSSARVRGDWRQVEARVARGLSLDARQSEQARADPDFLDRVAQRANAFRYERNLEAVEDLEKWLQNFEISAEAWEEWARWEVLRESAGPDESDSAGSVDVVDERVLTDAICSRDLERFAHELAVRAAVHSTHAAPHMAGDPPDLEASYQSFKDRVATPEAAEAIVAMHALEWTRVIVEALHLSTIDEAREACIAARDDGTSFADVAREARASIEVEETFLEDADVEGAWRERLTSAQPHDFVGPCPSRAGFRLGRVVSRVLPSVDDPTVFARARQTLIERAAAREVTRHVRWLWPR